MRESRSVASITATSSCDETGKEKKDFLLCNACILLECSLYQTKVLRVAFEWIRTVLKDQKSSILESDVSCFPFSSEFVAGLAKKNSIEVHDVLLKCDTSRDLISGLACLFACLSVYTYDGQSGRWCPLIIRLVRLNISS